MRGVCRTAKSSQTVRRFTKVVAVALSLALSTPASAEQPVGEVIGPQTYTVYGTDPHGHPSWGDFLIVAVIVAVIAWFAKKHEQEQARKTSPDDDRVTPDHMTDTRMDQIAGQR